ncbi:CBS domain-containing protein [Kitasatospora sp. NBC_01287]|uniref:CBS domain-containing protein n=1 Tax=Kitasatospora sp. NBC_01287 TaxID=2903573 RepID=UPI00224E4206|nr:CBS domain-containing protein [Kitasatospora sp. NBC_01287]MCX4747746.1 CBS domain-containing protein [Kitasatospora sp. NBC_01287]
MTIHSAHAVRSGPGAVPAPAVVPGLTVADAMEPFEYQIADDSPVDRANDIFRSAHVPYLLVRDHDGRCEGLVTESGFLPFLAGSWYTQRTAIRDTAHQRGPFAWPTMALALAGLAMKIKRLAVWPVIDEDGYTLGVITADRVKNLLALAPAAAPA